MRCVYSFYAVYTQNPGYLQFVSSISEITFDKYTALGFDADQFENEEAEISEEAEIVEEAEISYEKFDYLNIEKSFRLAEMGIIITNFCSFVTFLLQYKKNNSMTRYILIIWQFLNAIGVLGCISTGWASILKGFLFITFNMIIAFVTIKYE